MRISVRVPATSANLGPGFDTAGMALGLYDDVEVRALGVADVRVDVVGEGAEDLPSGEDHLVVRAMRHALDHPHACRLEACDLGGIVGQQADGIQTK